ncbi:hypothetical protein HDU79_006460 [Rhizoclosmatium sp. JEL0117]|nr:hypothetical protein HDU79_006460 [Rhizoclosmatium sp. JEL0117]
MKTHRKAPASFRTSRGAIALLGLSILSIVRILTYRWGSIRLKSSDVDSLHNNADKEWVDFLYGPHTNLNLTHGYDAKSSIACGGQSLTALSDRQNSPGFWTLTQHEGGFMIQPKNASLLPCPYLSNVSFSVTLENCTTDPIFHFPLGNAVANRHIPGSYHIYASLSLNRYLPERKYILTAELTETKVSTKPGHTIPPLKLESQRFELKNQGIKEKNLCAAHQLEALRAYRDSPIRTIVGVGTQYDRHIPLEIKHIMNATFEHIHRQDEKAWYWETARFVTGAYKKEGRGAVLNQFVKEACKQVQIKFLDLTGFGTAWRTKKLLENDDAVYDRIADLYLYDLGFRI